MLVSAGWVYIVQGSSWHAVGQSVHFTPYAMYRRRNCCWGGQLHQKWLLSLQVEAISRERSDVLERLTHAQVRRQTANPACWEAPQHSWPGICSSSA